MVSLRRCYEATWAGVRVRLRVALVPRPPMVPQSWVVERWHDVLSGRQLDSY